MTYRYDDANRLTSVTDLNASVTGYAYDDAGRMTTELATAGLGLGPCHHSPHPCCAEPLRSLDRLFGLSPIIPVGEKQLRGTGQGCSVAGFIGGGPR
ncbi:RHS repeat protein [bacterium]|nr:RHS repeat protein [bacterium]